MEQRQGFSSEIQERSEGLSIGFYTEYDGTRFALGWQVYCSDCRKPCFSSMGYYPCKDVFLIDRIVCNLGCRKSWRLDPDCEKPICH
jgi:hypothetical protein